MTLTPWQINHIGHAVFGSIILISWASFMSACWRRSTDAQRAAHTFLLGLLAVFCLGIWMAVLLQVGATK